MPIKIPRRKEKPEPYSESGHRVVSEWLPDLRTSFDVSNYLKGKVPDSVYLASLSCDWRSFSHYLYVAECIERERQIADMQQEIEYMGWELEDMIKAYKARIAERQKDLKALERRKRPKRKPYSPTVVTDFTKPKIEL